VSEGRPFFSPVSTRRKAGAYAYLQNYCTFELKKRITVYLYGNTDTGAFTQLHYVRQFQEGLKKRPSFYAKKKEKKEKT